MPLIVSNFPHVPGFAYFPSPLHALQSHWVFDWTHRYTSKDYETCERYNWTVTAFLFSQDVDRFWRFFQSRL